MFINNNQANSIQTLQNCLSQLENQLLRFKLLFIQLPSLKNPCLQAETIQKYIAVLDSLQRSTTKFCNKYEQEFINLQNRLTRAEQKLQQSKTEQKYQVVIDKIKKLQSSLTKTQLNQNKLIEAINSLMTKYQIYERPAIIQNDQYLRSRIQTSRVSSIITFQPNNPHVGQSINKSNNSQQNLCKTIKRNNQSNIYLCRQGSHNQSYSPNHLNKQFIRTFSKPSTLAKISLRQVNGVIHQNRLLNNSNQKYQRSSNSQDSRFNSVDRNEHRIKFMINKLHE